MKRITLQQVADLLEVMTIAHSTDSVFPITHHGHIAGAPMIIVTTLRGTGGYILQ